MSWGDRPPRNPVGGRGVNWPGHCPGTVARSHRQNHRPSGYGRPAARWIDCPGTTWGSAPPAAMTMTTAMTMTRTRTPWTRTSTRMHGSRPHPGSRAAGFEGASYAEFGTEDSGDTHGGPAMGTDVWPAAPGVTAWVPTYNRATSTRRPGGVCDSPLPASQPDPGKLSGSRSRAVDLSAYQVMRASVDLRVRACRRGASRFVLLRCDVPAPGPAYGGGTWVPCRSRTVRGLRNAVRRPAPQPRRSTPWCLGAVVPRSHGRHRALARRSGGIGVRRGARGAA